MSAIPSPRLPQPGPLSAEPASSEPFFTTFAWFLLLFVFASFGAKAIFDTDDLPPLTMLHHAHALAMLAWFALFALQPTLVRRGRVQAHRALGRLSPLVVLAFIGFALPIAQLNWVRIGDPLIVTANSVNLSLFLGLYIAAIVRRRDPASHKRLMVYATLMLMGPAAGRIPELFDQTPMLAVPIIFTLQLAPLAHDLLAHRRVHPATWVGFTLVLVAIALILGLSGSAAWVQLIETVLGPPGVA
jgi:hypothetical protein